MCQILVWKYPYKIMSDRTLFLEKITLVRNRFELIQWIVHISSFSTGEKV